MKKTKIGISGVGKMGLLHKKTYEEMNNVEIVSLYDPNKQFDSLDKFMDSLKHLDGVSICSPNKYHVDSALAFLDRNPNLKLMIEKPISHSVVKAEKLLPFLNNIMVGHIERCNPVIEKMKSLILNGEMGKINSIVTKRNCSYEPSGKNSNVAKDLLIHDIDILNYLSGAFPEKIDSIYINDGGYISASHMFGKYKRFVFYAEACWSTSVRDRRIIINASNGLYEGDYIAQTLYHKTLDKEEYISIKKQYPLTIELNKFVKMIDNDERPTCSIVESINALKIVSKGEGYEL